MIFSGMDVCSRVLARNFEGGERQRRTIRIFVSMFLHFFTKQVGAENEFLDGMVSPVHR